MAETPITPPESPKPARPQVGSRRIQPPLMSQLWEALKTLVWVVPLTILIWFYAEREQSRREDKVKIPIAVHIDSGDKIVKLTDPGDGKITASFVGPSANVQALLARITNIGDSPLVTVRIPGTTPPGPTQIANS